MPNFTPEVRNGKPDYDKGSLEGSVANFSGLKKLVLLGLASVLISGCKITPEGRQFINNMGYTATGTFIQESVSKEVWGSGQNVQQGINYNPEEQRILEQVNRMSRVICVGDVNHDGEPDWVYHDGNGNRYWAYESFANEDNKILVSSQREGKFSERVFLYLNQKGDLDRVQNNALIIYYQNGTR